MIIGIDLDDVVMNTFPGWLAFCNQQYAEQFSVEDFTHHHYEVIWGITRDEKWQRLRLFDEAEDKRGILPMSGAKEAIVQLVERHELHIITARPVELAPWTHEWIQQHFPKIFADVHFCSKDFGGTYHRPKHTVCEAIGATLHIEDHPETAQVCAEAGIDVHLFDQPWNRSASAHNSITRVSSWEEILKILC